MFRFEPEYTYMLQERPVGYTERVTSRLSQGVFGPSVRSRVELSQGVGPSVEDIGDDTPSACHVPLNPLVSRLM